MQIHRVGYRIKGYSQVVKLGHLWDMTSKDALQRIKILEFAERHGQGAAIDAFEVSSRTLYRWRRALKLHNNRISALTPKSCAPHRKRPPATAPAVAAQIRAMRFHKHHPNMGKATIHASEEFRRWCRENRVALPSVSTIGRIIARAPDKMRHAPLRLGPRGQPKSVRQQHKTRRIKGYQPAPLELIAGDTIVRMRDGIRRYLTTFIDPNSRLAVAFASRTASSRQATLTLNALIDLLPTAPKYLLTDNGSEFMGDFQKRLDELHITHWWTYPNSPKMNPHAERFNRTIQESFVDYHDDLLFSDLTLFNQKLAEWLVFYNTQRPHLSLKRQSPIQYLSQQLPYCQRYWTCTPTCRRHCIHATVRLGWPPVEGGTQNISNDITTVYQEVQNMEIQSTNIPRMDITSMVGPGIHLPCINEMAAVVIGCVLTSPKASQEDKESTRELLSSLETVDVVYQQNTADELNIVVPDFPEFTKKLSPLTQEQLANISGGFEIIVALFFTFADTAIGCALGSIGVALGVGAGITLSGTTLYLGSSVLAGMAVVGGITALAVTSAVGVGISIGVAAHSDSERPSGPINVGIVA